MEDLEDRQLEIEGKICGFSKEKLFEFAEFLKVDVSDYHNKGRRALAKKLRDEFENVLEQHENKLAFVAETLIHVTEKVEDYEKAKKEYEELQEKYKTMVEEQEKILEAAKKKISEAKIVKGSNEGNAVETVSTILNCNTGTVGSLLRREFKIAGTIDGESTKDKLSFVGLIRQIEGGLTKGYPEREIVDAVIRSVSSGSKLKAYLEMTASLTLPKLRQILRAHYQEKSGSELYQELTTIVQNQKESPSDFLLRAMSVRERIIFTSQEETGIKYEPKLVKSLFRHAVETGLREEVVRNKLRPVLHNAEITDEKLMENLNKIVSEESERQLKLGSRDRNTKQSSTSIAHVGGQITDNTKSKQTKSFNLQATLEAVQTELAELKMKVNANNYEMKNNPTPRLSGYKRRKVRCKACEEIKADRCEHCFKCGSKDHLARGCKIQMSGNSTPLQPWDRK